jgi:hypothetical protein
VRLVTVGDAKTLAAKREGWMAYFMKMGVTPERILARIGKPSVVDIGLDELEVFIGLETSLRAKLITPDEAFPALDHTADKSRDLEAKLGVAPRAPKSSPKAPPVVLDMPEPEPAREEG